MVRRRTRATKPPGNVAAEAGAASNELLLSGGVLVAVANGSRLEDQYFASPKRKDCKIDNGVAAAASALGVCEGMLIKAGSCKTKAVGNTGKPKRERGGIAGRTIGVPLATRSQTQTIEGFFKANTATKLNALQVKQEPLSFDETYTPSGSPPTPPPPPSENNEFSHEEEHCESVVYTPKDRNSASHMAADFIFDLSEDTNDSDHTDEYSDEVAGGVAHAIDFSTHRSSLRDSRSSHSSSSTNTTTTDNIFLQEPVLTLNVDKTPNQASSIKINRTLEIEPIFSSPPSLSSAALNGRFNQIVTLNGTYSPSKRDSFGFESKAMTAGYAALLPDNDNSSCDSGVAFTNSVDNNNSPPLTHAPEPPTVVVAAAVQARRRKPATPHRILCPSPIKSCARVASPAAVAAGICHSPSTRKFATAKEQLSPRKSQRHLAAISGKTRRRLNQQKEPGSNNHRVGMAGAMNEQLAQNQNGLIDLTPVVNDDNDQNQEFENLDDIEDIEFGEITTAGLTAVTNATTTTTTITATAKSILSIKHPTAQQNTSNNNKTGAKSKASGKSSSTQPPKTKHQLPLAATNGNRELSEFFPVRRSVRKTKTAVKEEMMRSLEQAILEEREEGLKVENFEGKGRGIVAERQFQRGEFVVEYVGDLISMTEAGEREKRYALDENAGCYMYYFKHKNQQYCIDATADTGKLGRLVNHSRNGNLVTKVVVVKQRPHLILIAKDGIEPGEELTYDYGDRSKESLLHHPWLAF